MFCRLYESSILAINICEQIRTFLIALVQTRKCTFQKITPSRGRWTCHCSWTFQLFAIDTMSTAGNNCFWKILLRQRSPRESLQASCSAGFSRHCISVQLVMLAGLDTLAQSQSRSKNTWSFQKTLASTKNCWCYQLSLSWCRRCPLQPEDEHWIFIPEKVKPLKLPHKTFSRKTHLSRSQ